MGQRDNLSYVLIMHFYFVVVDALAKLTSIAPSMLLQDSADSTQCNISLTMSKDVWTQVNDSPTQSETLNFVDIVCPCKNYGKLLPVKLILAISTIEPIGGMMN